MSEGLKPEEGMKPADHLETAHERIKELGELIEKSEWKDEPSKRLATFLYEDVDQALLEGISNVAGGNDKEQISSVAGGNKKPISSVALACSKRSIEGFIQEEISSNPFVDGYTWRKYGEKDILGFKHPRGYYKCINKNARGCPAHKTIQQIDGVYPAKFNVKYTGSHICMTMATTVTNTSTDMSMTDHQNGEAINHNQILQLHGCCWAPNKSMQSDNCSANSELTSIGETAETSNCILEPDTDSAKTSNSKKPILSAASGNSKKLKKRK